MANRQRIVLGRRSFLKLSAAGLAASGLHFAIDRTAYAEMADPESDTPESFTIADLIERTDDRKVEQFARTGTLSLWIASTFAASLSALPNFPTVFEYFGRNPGVGTQSIWGRLPEPILHAGPNDIVEEWIYRQVWEKLPPERRQYYHRAGSSTLRPIYRSLQEAYNVYKTIPLGIVLGEEEALSKFHKNKHWSHIIPSSQGGSDRASNGIFEAREPNWDRGNRPMTKIEFERAQRAIVEEAEQTRLQSLSRGEERLAKTQITSIRRGLSSPALRPALVQATRPILLGAGAGAAAIIMVDVALTCMEEGLRYHDGEIGLSELFSSVAARVGKNSLLAVGVLGIVLGLVMIVPALGALLTSLAPVMVVMTFLLYGREFYSLSSEWVDRFGLEPVLAAWNNTKEIPKQAWAHAADSFESFRQSVVAASEWALEGAGDATGRALQGIGDLSEDALYGIGDFTDYAWQGLGGAPRNVLQGTRGVTIRTWQGAGAFSDGAIEDIGDFSDRALQGVGDFSDRAWQGAGEFSDGALYEFGNIPGGVWETAGESSEQALEKAKELLEEAEEKLQNIWPFGE